MSDDPKCVAGCVPFYGGEKRHHKDCPYYPESLTKVNADRIEELEELLKAAQDDAKEAEAYAEELEAKLAKAMETLDTIRTASEFHSQAGISDCVMRYAHECTCRLSDATLAELAGGKDE